MLFLLNLLQRRGELLQVYLVLPQKRLGHFQQFCLLLFP